jgi:hypothetical protein
MNISDLVHQWIGPVVVGECILVLLGLVLIVGHSLWLQRDKKQNRLLLIRAHKKLASLLHEDLPPGYVQQFEHLSVRLQIRLFAGILPSLSGGQRQRLAGLAADLGLVKLGLNQCRSRLWWRRLRGARLCTLFAENHALIATLLTDSHPVVRAQAAEWASDHPTPLLIEHLLDLLHDKATLCDYSAKDALLRMGSSVIEPLACYLSTHSDEACLESALTVALGLASPQFLPPALALCRHQSPRVRLRAVSILGALGGIDGVSALMERLNDPAAEVRTEAARALGALGYWPAASRLAAALRDPAWTVRRESALSLRELGAPGLLFLRQTLSETDQFAADIARQVLDSPETTAVYMPTFS